MFVQTVGGKGRQAVVPAGARCCQGSCLLGECMHMAFEHLLARLVSCVLGDLGLRAPSASCFVQPPALGRLLVHVVRLWVAAACSSIAEVAGRVVHLALQAAWYC